jgi:hypothetical protein
MKRDHRDTERRRRPCFYFRGRLQGTRYPYSTWYQVQSRKEAKWIMTSLLNTYEKLKAARGKQNQFLSLKKKCIL